MNLVQMICCVLVSKASEFGQTYLSNKVGTSARRAQTVDNANRFIESAVQELEITSSDLCKCALPSPTPVGRRMSWNQNPATIKSDQ